MTATPGKVWRLTLGLLLGALPVTLWPGAIARAAALWPAAGETALPWLPGHGVLVLVGVPLLTLSAATLFLAPGLLLALLARRGTSLPVWFLSAVPFAVAGAALVVTVLQWSQPGAPSAWMVGAAAMALTTMAGALAALGSARAPIPWPVATARAGLPLGVAVVALLLATVMLAPKLLWESFNGDGAHAFEASRLLLTRAWPFFPADAGDIAGFPGPTSLLFTWPNAWFLGLLGPVDAAVRLPFVIYLPLLLLALHAVAEEGGRRVGGRTVATLWLAAIPFVLAMAYSASYEPYHADLALPGVQDLLLLIGAVGFFHAMIRREPAWIVAFAILSHLSLPNGLVLVGFWLLAELLVMRPVPWRALRLGGGAAVVCVAVSAAMPVLLGATGQVAPGNEYGLARAIGDVLHVNPFEWRRLGWLLIGGAIFPVVTLAWWRRQDDVARRVSVVTVGYFLFFHIQARVSLHHFAPAMVLPLIVAARIRPAVAAELGRYLWSWRIAALVAIVLAAPRSFAIATSTRTVGRAIAQRVGSHADSDARVFRAASLLNHLFPPAWSAAVPERTYGGSPLAWLRYAGTDTTAAYLLLPRDRMAAIGGSVVAMSDDAVLIVRDSATLTRHRNLRPGTDRHAPVFAVPRTTLFGGAPGSVDLLDWLRRRGVR